MIKPIATAAALLMLLAVLIIAVATAAVGGSLGLAVSGGRTIADIPGRVLGLYQAAGARYRVAWELVAAVGKVECDHGRSPLPACRQQGEVNAAGAGGPMQFLAGTWQTYGVDANRDGQADRWDQADAIFAAARYLRASGAPNDPDAAVYAYNHSATYVAQVLGLADRYRTQASTPAAPDLADPSALAQAVLADPRIELRPEAAADIRAGRIDARLLSCLLALADRFRLAGVGPLITGHSYDVAGTNRPSNHAYGRAVDIGSIDGAPVSAGSAAARALALAVAELPAAIRPDEIGSPFDLRTPGAFTDAAHSDHIHLGYDQ